MKIRLSAALVALAGSAHAIGQALPPAQIQVAQITPETGALFFGGNSYAEAGYSVSSAGDINGDGFTDLVIGARQATTSIDDYSGAAYVVFGTPNPFPAGGIDLSTLDGTNGFKIVPETGSTGIGEAVSPAGDVNGDGVDDLIIGAIFTSTLGRLFNGAAYVIFGSQTIGSTGEISTNEFNSTSTGFAIVGAESSDRLGSSVSSGDVNGDGFSDLIVGSQYADNYTGVNTGVAYIVFGGPNAGATPVVDVSVLNGPAVVAILGKQDDGGLDISVASGGDFNGDGFDDILVGFPSTDSGSYYGGATEGVTYVIYGSPIFPQSSTISESSLLSGERGLQILGFEDGDRSGAALSITGDVTGDGLDDIILGAPRTDVSTADDGKVHVIAGDPFFGEPNSPAFLNIGVPIGFEIFGTANSARAGSSVDSSGDINADGRNDILIGAFGATLSGVLFSGEAYALFDLFSSPSASILLSSLDGVDGYQVEAASEFAGLGTSVTSGFDLNGDGIDDAAYGAPFETANGANSVGAVHVVFGRPSQIWTSPVSGDFTNPDNWFTEEAPTAGIIQIQPEFGATITLPAGAYSFDRADLGGPFGQTRLALESGAVFVTERTLAIPSTAAIAGAGIAGSQADLNIDGLIEMNGLTLAANSININGSGRLNADQGVISGNIYNDGEITLESLSGGSGFTTLDILGGDLVNGATGRILIYNNAILSVDPLRIIESSGQFNVVDSTAIINGATVINASSFFSVSTDSTVTLNNNLENQGAALVEAGSRLNILGDLSGNGVSGGGTVFVAGEFNPARSMQTGHAEFGGDLSLGFASATQIELASGASFDRVTSLGTVALSGELTVALLGEYAPQAGDSFPILSAASVSGAFTNVNYPEPPAGAEWDLVYTGNSVVLSLQASNPADLNGDGCVDTFDLASLLAAWGGPAADLNSDGVTDTFDLAILLAAWGGC